MIRPRKILGALLFVVLGLTNVLLLAWLLRDAWLTPIVRREVSALVGGALDGEFRIGSIEGSWLRGMRITGIQARSDAGPIRAVEDGIIEAALAPMRLADGDLTGLRGARFRARHVEIALPPPSGATEEAPVADAWPPLDGLRGWLSMLPDGAAVDVDRFVLRDASGVAIVDGALRVVVSPRPRRRASVTGDGVRAELIATADGLVHLDLAIGDAPRHLRALGVDVPIDGGTLVLDAEGDLDARDLGVAVSWDGGRLRDRGPSSLRGHVNLRGGSLTAELDVDGPGGHIEVRDLGIALADLDETLRAARGDIAIDIRDLEPWRAVLPAAIAERLPIRGRLRAVLDGDGLAVGRGALAGKGIELAVEGGRLPLTGEARDRARLAARVTTTESWTIPIGGDTITLAGSVRGTVEGSLARPRGRLEFELGEGSGFGQAFGALSGRATLADDVVRVTALDARDVRPASAATGAGAALRGDLTLRLPTASGLEMTVDLRMSGTGSPWLTTYAPGVGLPIGDASLAVRGAVTFGSSSLPSGDVTIGIDALQIGDGASTGALRVQVAAPTDGAQAFELGFDGLLAPASLTALGVPDLDAAPGLNASARGSWTAEGPAAVDATVVITDLRYRGAMPARVTAAAAISPDGTLEIRDLTARGPLDVEAMGTLPPLTSDAPLMAGLTVRIADAARLGPAFGLPRGASAQLRATLGGTRAAPDAQLTLDAAAPDAAAWLEGVIPSELGSLPAGALDVALVAAIRDGALAIERLDARVGADRDHAATLELTGAPPLRWRDGRIESGDGTVTGSLEVPLDRPDAGSSRVRTNLHWDPMELRLDAIRIGTPFGSASGSLRVLGPADALAGTPLADLPITGNLTLDTVDVAAAPIGLLPRQLLAGTGSAALSVGGRLGAPEPTGEVSVRGGRVKLAADVPILEGVELHVTAGPKALELDRLEGRIGSGRFSAHGRISGDDLIGDPRHAGIDVELRADEVLLVRASGRKLRANAAITARGDLTDLRVAGEVDVTSGKFIRRISLVPDLGARGGTAVGSGIELFSIPPPLGDALHFDVAIKTTQDPIDVVTYVFNAPLTTSMRLLGTGAQPYLEGAVSASSGSIRLPAVTMRIDQALVTFTANDPKHPKLLVRASTRRYGIDVNMTATGRSDSVEVLLSSMPPMTQQEILVLVSTGVPPQTLQEQGLSGRASMVGGYLAQEILDFYFGSDSTEQGESIIDRFHFYSGREVSRNGVESIVVEFDVTDRIGLEGERDVYEDYNMGILYRIRF